MPQISVIIPCYNQEKYITEAIEAVLTQSFDDYEIIIVNDGSVDNSLKIIKEYASKYPNKIRYIDQKNQGVIASRNNAIAKAKGEYIFPLDGDDKIASNCLEKLHNAMINYKGDVIYCDVEYFGNKTGRMENLAPTKFNMCLCNRVCVSALYRKKDWQRYGGYDEIMKQGLEDWEFWLNFVEDNKSFYKVDEPLLFYRILDSSRNSSISKSLEKELYKKVRKKHKKLFFKFSYLLLFNKIIRFFYQRKITKSGKLCIKICKIPLPKKLIQLLSKEINHG